jgi:hypothetical protein
MSINGSHLKGKEPLNQKKIFCYSFVGDSVAELVKLELLRELEFMQRKK